MLREFWDIFVKQYGRTGLAMSIGGLALGISLLEGFNIGLLVPMLETLESGEAGGHWVSQALALGFGVVGIPFRLPAILLALGILITIVAGLKYLRLVLMAKMQSEFITWIRTTYMGSLLRADLAYFHSEQMGSMTNILTSQAERAAASAGHMAEIITGLLLIMAYMVTAFLIAPGLTAGAFGMVLIVSLGVQYYVRRAREKAQEGVERNREYQVAALENLSGIHVIKTFLLEKSRWADFSSRAGAVGLVTYQIGKIRSKLTIIQEVALFVMIGGIVYLGVSVFSLDIAVIVALLFILYRMMPRVAGLNTLRQDLAESMTSLHAVAVAMEAQVQPSIVSGQTPFESLKKDIVLQDIGFSYNGSGPVLDRTSFSIEKGKMTAIVGASGAGKSTLMELLLRFYDPAAGHILVDGVDLKDLDLESWRRYIGVVSQDVFLFNDTVANNIGLGRPGVTATDVEMASKQAYAHDFIVNLPQGYDTTIGDRGWNLSGGQRQRIALARAIVGGPQILVLDEATSALDSESEQLIQKYMNGIRGTCTLVVVAHRTATIRNADTIVVLQDGRIVEQGDWDSLMDSAGVFANYQQLQAGG